MTREVLSASADATEALAAHVAERLCEGDVVTVSGELGTGKTTFVRGACRALGVSQPVTSPTFTIGHRYRGRVDVTHLDLFRFAGVSPAEWGISSPTSTMRSRSSSGPRRAWARCRPLGSGSGWSTSTSTAGGSISTPPTARCC